MKILLIISRILSPSHKDLTIDNNDEEILEQTSTKLRIIYEVKNQCLRYNQSLKEIIQKGSNVSAIPQEYSDILK